MSQRFFVQPPIAGRSVVLSGSEAQHAMRVMRLAVGARVCVFDGTGREWEAEVIELARHELKLRLLEGREVSRETSRELTLAVALPKGDRQRWLIEKATELGVARVVPLLTARGAQPSDKTLRKLRRFVVEASKQCGRNRLMAIDEPLEIRALLDTRTAEQFDWRAVADPDGLPWQPPDRESRIATIVGPEGGLTPDERNQAVDAGWQPISLGARILRIETAALAIAAQLG